MTEQLVDVRDHARDAAREVKFGLNGVIIARDTEAEAKERCARSSPRPTVRLWKESELPYSFQDKISYFGSRVLPLVRKIENAEQKWADAPVLVSA